MKGRTVGPPPVRDLASLLNGLRPTLHADRYVFASVQQHDPALQADALATVREQEGVTLVLREETARRAGLRASPVFRCITLHVFSDLMAVGLVATSAAAWPRSASPATSCRPSTTTTSSCPSRRRSARWPRCRNCRRAALKDRATGFRVAQRFSAVLTPLRSMPRVRPGRRHVPGHACAGRQALPPAVSAGVVRRRVAGRDPQHVARPVARVEPHVVPLVTPPVAFAADHVVHVIAGAVEVPVGHRHLDVALLAS